MCILDRQSDAHLLLVLQYNFEGRLDLIKFIKLIQDHDMYAIVRIGPFIQAEWNHGSVHSTICHAAVQYAHII
jgi:beta-galactosidase GanA